MKKNPYDIMCYLQNILNGNVKTGPISSEFLHFTLLILTLNIGFCFATVKNIFLTVSPTDGAALPLTFDSTPSASPRQPQVNKPVQKRLSDKPQKRTAECCRSGNSYIREQFCPGPTSMLVKQILF